MKLSVHVKEKAKFAPSDQALVIDLTQFGYVKLLGKGMLPEGRPVVVKEKLLSKTMEKKTKEAGRAVMLTA